MWDKGQTSSSQSRDDSGSGRASIVVVEDNATDVFLIREAIAARHLNIDMMVFEDGEEAINLIAYLDSNEAAVCPQLVLLDLNLPKTDGFAVLEALRRSRRCAGVPVIVMTSSAAQTDKSRSAELGANDYFQKPSGYDEFLKIGDIVAQRLDEN